MGLPAVAAIVVLGAVTIAAGWLIEHAGGGAVDAFDLRVANDLVARRTPTIDGLTGFGAQLAGPIPVTARGSWPSSWPPW